MSLNGGHDAHGGLRRPLPIARPRASSHAAAPVRRRRPRPRTLPPALAKCSRPRGDREPRQGTQAHPRNDELKLLVMRERVCEARRIVVKLGSNLFFNEGGAIALGRI